MLFNGRTLILTFSRTQVRIAEHERLQSLFKMSMVYANNVYICSCVDNNLQVDEHNGRCCVKFEDDSEHWTLMKDIQKGICRSSHQSTSTLSVRNIICLEI